MMGSFRIRMLVVVVIATLVGLSVQSNHSSRRLVEPVLNFVLKDYGVEQKLARLTENTRLSIFLPPTIPASSSQNLKLPCEFLKVEKEYGWHWDDVNRQQEFFPGVILEVKENTLVRPVLGGTVVEITDDDQGRSILLHHQSELYSLYGGLDEVLVEEGVQVKSEQLLGKASQQLYFELRDQEGPVNPEFLLD